MNAEVVISVEGLGKKYSIRHERERYTALRDVIAQKVSAPFRRLRDNGRSKIEDRRSGNGNSQSSSLSADLSPLSAKTPSPSSISNLPSPKTSSQSPISNLPSSKTSPTREDFWALKDVSFSVARGEVLGIIGRNGAGKTTLLKILSRITEPTEGRVRIKGRVASLLEVGTGFHPELTGRENIFLNGAILGMSKAEIKKKFDEIVAFAETEKFLDTPVKRYSSGMYVRLAFAVAAHLEPEILVVDEVLAVGDAEFQKKCLGKMQDVSTKEGRTVLFVSHNMSAVSRLCSDCLWLDKGGINMHGSTSQTIRAYLAEGSPGSATIEWGASEAPGDKTLRLKAVRVCQPDGVPKSKLDMSQPITIEIETDTETPASESTVGLFVLSPDGTVVLHTSDIFCSKKDTQAGQRLHTCVLPAYTLNIGSYMLSIAADIPRTRVIFYVEGVLRWTVLGTDQIMDRYDTDGWPGVIGPRIASWHVSDRLDAASSE